MIKIIKRICWKKEGEMNRLNSNIWTVKYNLQKKLVTLAEDLAADLNTEMIVGTWEMMGIQDKYFKEISIITAEIAKCDEDVNRNHKIHSRWWSLEFFTVKKVLKALASPFVKLFQNIILYPIHDLKWHIQYRKMEKREVAQ